MSYDDDENPSTPRRGVKAPYRHQYRCEVKPAPGLVCGKLTLSIESHPEDNRYAILCLGIHRITVLRDELTQRVAELETCVD